MKKKLLAFILCICIISTFCLQPAYAMGAEGVIIGGGAAVGLSMPQVALLVAAGYGLIFAVQHADALASGLTNALENAATNITNGLEDLTYWKEQATKGAIAIASAPAWITEGIKDWVNTLYESKDIAPTGMVYTEYAANENIPLEYWANSPTYYNYPADTIVLRAGNAGQSGEYWDLYMFVLVISTEKIGDIHFRRDGVTYYMDWFSFSTNPPISKPLSQANQKVYNAISQLPSLNMLNEMYNTANAFYSVSSAFIDGFFDSYVNGNSSITPDHTISGIDDAIGTHGIDNIKMPDLDIGGSKLLAPDVAGGSIDNALDNTLTGLKNKEITWEKYMDDVAAGNPSISIPVEGEGVKDFPITDTGVSDIPIDTPIPDNPAIPGNPSVEVPEGLEPFTISRITDLFPFCIPFDIVDFVNVLCAEPEAPKIEWEFTWYDGSNDTLTIDLSPFNSVAQLLRNMELLLFCVGLAMITRNQIRG